jgi:15-cis-phytoene synthase
MNLFDETCYKCSEVITRQYSTSFSSGIRAFHKRFRNPVYAIYGFVRYADEIVDTFHDFDKQALMADFRRQTFQAIEQGISLNPVLQSFQQVVNRYGIDLNLIDAFLISMERDLAETSYDADGYQEYIYGSAEVVGLMCLRVFCEGDTALYDKLLPYARSLGAAFQKVNFLRDMKDDLEERGRVYFPGVDFSKFCNEDKSLIEADIEQDFNHALEGIRLLPRGAKAGVYIAYVYYRRLFKKICLTSPGVILQQRVRISNSLKMALYARAMMQQKLNLV